MMSKQSLCCEKCLEELGKKCPSSAGLWMNICDLYLQKEDGEIIVDDDFPALTFLEQNGFVVTTDISHCILINLKSVYWRNNQPVFCIKEGQHG